MIYTKLGFEIKTQFSARKDRALSEWLNQEVVYDNFSDYLLSAEFEGFNAYELLTLKGYITTLCANQGYHCFHLSKHLRITKQLKMNKTFMSFEGLFMRDDAAITPFKDLYDHYLSTVTGVPMSKVRFSKELRNWCSTSISKHKLVDGKPIRALTGIIVKQGEPNA